MSVSDPLIKELKGWLKKLIDDVTGDQNDITDHNSNFQQFCLCLEQIFKKGLAVRSNTLGFSKQMEAWIWLQKISTYKNFGISHAYITAVERVNSYPSVSTNIGKLRLLIRSCLVHRCLHVPVQALGKVPDVTVAYNYHNSILGDEILREIFFSLLLQCANLKFNLILSHATFLDHTWKIPTYETFELVPCTSLGMSVTFINGKAVIVDIKPSSVADDEKRIEKGDVLDELNGEIITSATRGKLGSIMRKGLGKPIQIRIIKLRCKDSNEMFTPIISLLKQLKIDINYSEHDLTQSTIKITESKKDNVKIGYKAFYVGNVSLGKKGDVKQIEKAVSLLLANKNKYLRNSCDCDYTVSHVKKEVLFEIQEMGIRIVDYENGNEVLKHSYMEISSCGITANMKNYFAYIGGDQYCNLSKSFICYVFSGDCDETVQFILQSIGQGFHRTHYAV